MVTEVARKQWLVTEPENKEFWKAFLGEIFKADDFTA